jgi:hypothetical protein
VAAPRLAQAIEAKALPLLKELNVGSCEMDGDAAKALAKAMTTGGVPELQAVDISNCRFGHQTAAALGAVILKGCPKVSSDTLRMQSYRHFGDMGKDPSCALGGCTGNDGAEGDRDDDGTWAHQAAAACALRRLGC